MFLSSHDSCLILVLAIITVHAFGLPAMSRCIRDLEFVLVHSMQCLFTHAYTINSMACGSVCTLPVAAFLELLQPICFDRETEAFV